MVQICSYTSRLKALKYGSKQSTSDAVYLLLNSLAEGKDFITAHVCSDLTTPESLSSNISFQTPHPKNKKNTNWQNILIIW